MNLKIFRFAFFIILNLVGLTSCLDDNDDNSTSTSYKDAQIYAFSLSNEDVSGLSSVSFTIDHINGLIYNADSMAYGTEVSKVLCNITANASGVLVIPEATNEEVAWSSSDSIDFSKPVKFVVSSLDKIEKKTYTARLNIHQQDGDAFTWKQVTDKATNKAITSQKTILFNNAYYSYINTNEGVLAYVSFDKGITWSPLTIDFTVELDVRNILLFKESLYALTSDGSIYQSVDGRKWSSFRLASGDEMIKSFIGVHNNEQCYALIEKDGVYYHAVSSDMTTWNKGADPIPSNFPISGFSAAFNESGFIVVGGRNYQEELLNTTWLTSNGITWIQTADEKNNYLSKREGAALVYYADKYCLIGGKDDSEYKDDMYVSVTNGVTWSKAKDLSLSDFYTPRAYASVLVEDETIYLFGGTNNTYWLDDVWSGFLNELKFAEK